MRLAFVPLTSDNLAAALRFREQLYRHEDLDYNPEGAVEGMQELMEHPEFGALWIIQVDGIDAGYILLTICYSLEFRGRFGLLDEFYIADSCRGQGAGTAAIEFVEAKCRARGLRALRLEVSHGNPRGQALYRRCGFATESRHLMTKWI